MGWLCGNNKQKKKTILVNEGIKKGQEIDELSRKVGDLGEVSLQTFKMDNISPEQKKLKPDDEGWFHKKAGEEGESSAPPFIKVLRWKSKAPSLPSKWIPSSFAKTASMIRHGLKLELLWMRKNKCNDRKGAYWREWVSQVDWVEVPH